MITNSRDSEFGDKMPRVLDFLNQIEANLKIKKTTCVQCEPTPRKYQKCKVWLFESSKMWQIAPPMISLYTLLIRVGFAHKIGTSWTHTINKVKQGNVASYQSGRYTSDKSQLKAAEEGIQRIIKYGPRRIFHRNIKKNYLKSLEIDSMHNEMGIVSFSQKETEIYVPYWHRF